MNEAGILAFLQAIDVSTKGISYNTEWLNCSCPLAPYYHAKGKDESPSFGVRISDDRKSTFKCLACGQKGSLSRLAGVLGKLRKVDYSKQQHWIEMAEIQAISSKPLREWDDQYEDEFDELVNNFKPNPANEFSFPLASGIPYLRKRGILWNDVFKLHLRFDSFQKRVLFPVYDEDGDFRGFSGRSILPSKLLTKKNPKVRDYYGLKKRELFLASRSIKKTLGNVSGIFGRQILVEGLFDYANMVSHGFVNTNASLGTSLTEEKIEILINRGLPVYFMFDPDKAGYDAVYGSQNKNTGEIDISTSWAHQLYEHIPVWICEYPDNCDADPAEIRDKNLLLDIVNSAKLFSPSR